MRSGSTGSCIDENVIGALFDHRLSQAEIDAIDEHVSTCSECRDLLCSLARLYASSSPSRPLVQTASMLDRRAPGARSRTAAAASLAAAPGSRAADEANIRRLLALLGCERQVGKVLCGKWRLDAVLGVGGMAEVYAATHLSNGRRAAIKLLRREWLTRPNIVFRFLREGYVANRLNHPRAVAILDDGTTDTGTPFLVLELLEGHTIAHHVRQRLPITTVLWIACQILDVLGAAHDQRIVHRDIKPENVFLTRSGEVKVLDFGIARLAESGASADRQTQQGTMMGTPAYMPPEQARGCLGEIDARSDLWALGATMFALLAGRPVRVGATPNETLVAAMKEPAPRLATVNPSLSREICDIVDRALAFRREDRWQSAGQMQAAIRDVMRRREGSLPRLGAGASTPPMVTSIDVTPTSKKRSSVGIWMSLAGVLVLATSVGVVARPWMARRAELASAKVAASTQISSLALPAATTSEPAPSGSAIPEVPPVKAAATTRASSAKPARRAPARHVEAPASSAPPPPPSTPPPAPPPEDHHPLDRRD